MPDYTDRMAESGPELSSLRQIRPEGIFVGRGREMAELEAALDDVLSGQGRFVMLSGEPGIGKTRTAQEFASHAGDQDAHVLWGRCYEDRGAPPYWRFIA